MKKGLFAFALASALVASQTATASESEFRNDGASKTATRFSGNLPLPPIPYLDTMPWIGFGAEAKSPGMGSFLMRNFDAPAIPKSPAFAITGNTVTSNLGNAEAWLSDSPVE
jgi:hypothetical protein